MAEDGNSSRVPLKPLQTQSSSSASASSSTAHHGPLRTPAKAPIISSLQTPSSVPSLLLTVRFSTALPDLLLDIPQPERTTVVAVKHQIRSRLDQPDSQRRLRFIHGGKILPDRAIVASVLKPLAPPPPSHPPPSSSLSAEAKHDLKGKGKAVESPLLQQRSSSSPSSPFSPATAGSHAQAQRVYVNCSIGDLLTDAELAQEARSAEEPVSEEAISSATSRHGRGANDNDARRLAGDYSGDGGGGGGTSAGYHYSSSAGDGGGGTLPSGPRGFDRLLTAGFTPAEVNQLRLQFRSITEARHTADSMPSPDSLRTMEDAWMESNNDGLPAGAATDAGGGGIDMDTGWGGAAGDPLLGRGGAGGGGGGDEYGLAGIVDLLVWGMFVGFVWPLGAIGWLVRGAEKIPKRMRVFVYCGFMLSFLVGIIRMIV